MKETNEDTFPTIGSSYLRRAPYCCQLCLLCLVAIFYGSYLYNFNKKILLRFEAFLVIFLL